MQHKTHRKTVFYAAVSFLSIILSTNKIILYREKCINSHDYTVFPLKLVSERVAPIFTSNDRTR